MEYIPRYAQPFTLEQAIHLEVPLITEEIGRLQNSLMHLRQTQEELREANDESPDPEFVRALEENTVVIGSQEERISILKMALEHKGILAGAHYDLPVAQAQERGGRSSPAPTPQLPSNGIEADDDGGIDL